MQADDLPDGDRASRKNDGWQVVPDLANAVTDAFLAQFPNIAQPPSRYVRIAWTGQQRIFRTTTSQNAQPIILVKKGNSSFSDVAKGDNCTVDSTSWWAYQWHRSFNDLSHGLLTGGLVLTTIGLIIAGVNKAGDWGFVLIHVPHGVRIAGQVVGLILSGLGTVAALVSRLFR